MLFKQMKYFMTVIDCNSFTEAAEQCFISQSAISQQIKSLEKELGVELLVRENRQFTLTPAGEYFYRHGKVLLDEIEDFKEETMGASLVFNPAAGSPALPSASRTYSGRETGRPAPEMMMSAPAFTAVLTYSS